MCDIVCEMTNTPPWLIVLVDIDGTIIGDIDLQLMEYGLVSSRRRGSEQAFRHRLFKDQLVAQLLGGLMRPGFPAFCAKCQSLDIPVVLYTASEHQWATFLAPRIEQAVRIAAAPDFRFASLLTRNDCHFDPSTGSCTKSLRTVASTLRETVPGAQSLTLDGLVKRMILVDNTAGVLDEEEHAVIVPTYKASFLYDITGNLPHSEIPSVHARLTPRNIQRVATADPRAAVTSAVATLMRKRSTVDSDARQTDCVWRNLKRAMCVLVEKGKHAGRRKGTDACNAARFLNKAISRMSRRHSRHTGDAFAATSHAL